MRAAVFRTAGAAARYVRCRSVRGMTKQRLKRFEGHSGLSERGVRCVTHTLKIYCRQTRFLPKRSKGPLSQEPRSYGAGFTNVRPAFSLRSKLRPD